jgi:hypothetical protein
MGVMHPRTVCCIGVGVNVTVYAAVVVGTHAVQ